MDPASTAVESTSTVLRLEGADALALIDRISTRSLADLAPGQARWAPFCDFRGRLLHRALVAVTSDRAVWLLRDDAPGLPLAAAVNAHVFREDVRIGVGDTRWSARLANLDPPTRIEEREGAPVAVPAGEGLVMVLDAPGSVATDPARERARIEAGRPRHGHEIAEAFTPFEVNLAHEVHLSKGCYTGQEALQRLITYDSVRRRLVRVWGTGAAPATPSDIVAANGTVGVLTSSAATTRGWIGLAVLKLDAAAGTTSLRIDGGPAIEIVDPVELTRPEGREGAAR